MTKVKKFFFQKSFKKNICYITVNILRNDGAQIILFRAIGKVCDHRQCSCPLCVPSVTSSTVDLILDRNCLESKIWWSVIVLQWHLQYNYNQSVENLIKKWQDRFLYHKMYAECPVRYNGIAPLHIHNFTSLCLHNYLIVSSAC